MDVTVGWCEGRVVPLGEWNAHYVRWRGRPGGPPTLLLHGFTAHAQSWQHLAHVLRTRGDVVALDQRGHGRSAAAPRFGTRPMVGDVEAILDHLGWETADLVGHSMGGMNAVLFAAEHAERVRRLVVVDIGPEVSASGAARIKANVGGQTDTFRSFEEAIAAARRMFPNADETLLRSRVEHNLRPAGARAWTWRTAAALRDGTAERDDHDTAEKWQAWSALRAPTLVVRGELSDVLDDGIAARMAEHSTVARFVNIAGATHSVPLDRPDELAGVVSGFLDEPL